MEASSTTAASTSRSSRTVLTKAKIDVEKFDGSNNFSMWQCEMLDALYQQELDIALEEVKPSYLDDDEWNRINRNACVVIGSCLTREMKFSYMKETSGSKL